MKVFIFSLFSYMTLVVMSEQSTAPPYEVEPPNTTSLLENMYEAKRGYWCRLCPAGEYLVKHCESHEGPSMCEPCADCFYMEKPNNISSCEECSYGCHIGQTLVRNCTKTSDLICHCPEGQYWLFSRGNGICTKYSVCDGEIKAEGTPWRDRVCGESTSTPEPVLTSPRTYPRTTLSTPQTTPNTCQSYNILPCDLQQQCCDKWKVTAVILLVLLVIAIAIIVLFIIQYCRKKKSSKRRENTGVTENTGMTENTDS